jgi:hypothetical protein
VTDQVEDFGDDEMAEVKRQDWGDPADVPVSPEELRNGGPTRSGGAVTTTGGKAGPARRARPVRPQGGKAAPTTTGDATSGGMGPRGGGSTSDATTGAESTTGTGRPAERRPHR